MVTLFFFSVSLLCSALSMKVEALNEANAPVTEMECAPRLALFTPAAGDASPSPSGELYRGDTEFYPAFRAALSQLACREIAQIQLPPVVVATEPFQPLAVLKSTLAALRGWEADYAICRSDSLVIAAVVQLRSADRHRDPERAKLESILERALAATQIPVVIVAEAPRYAPDHIAGLIRPHLVEAGGGCEVVRA